MESTWNHVKSKQRALRTTNACKIRRKHRFGAFENCGLSLIVRNVAAQVNVSRESIIKIPRNNLKLFLYKMQTTQTLTHDDNVRRPHFCQRINQATEQGTLNINTIVFSDEPHIYHDGFAKQANMSLLEFRKTCTSYLETCTLPKGYRWPILFWKCRLRECPH